MSGLTGVRQIAVGAVSTHPPGIDGEGGDFTEPLVDIDESEAALLFAAAAKAAASGEDEVIVPPIVRGLAVSKVNPVNGTLRRETAGLLVEKRGFKKPDIMPPGGMNPGETAATFAQRFKSATIGYNDVRDLGAVNIFTFGTPIGMLPLAAQRAVRRNRQRIGDTYPARILEIGAGHRFTAAGLKKLFGDQIQIYESSPVYFRGTPNSVDIEMPEAFIENAFLPENSFEFVYSIFGSFYGKNQILILQKIVDSLLVGGEAFLMWKVNSKTIRWSQLVKRWSAIFQQAGLDITVQYRVAGDYIPRDEEIFLVSLRKRQLSVDVQRAFKAAEDYNSKYPGVAWSRYPAGFHPNIRFVTGGPFFPGQIFSNSYLNLAGAIAVNSAADAVGIPLRDLFWVLSGENPKDCTPLACASGIAEKLLEPEDLMSGTPLSILVASRLYPAVYAAENGMTLAEVRMANALFYSVIFY